MAAVPFAEYRLERLPFTTAERLLKGTAKAALRFKD